MNYVYGFLVAAAVSLGLPISQDVVDEWAPYRAVVQLELGKLQGSGTLIATKGEFGLILSARHVCMRVGNDVTIRWYGTGNVTTKGKVLHIVEGRTLDTDLALVLSKGIPPGVYPVPVATTDISGPWVCAGYRGGKFLVGYADEGYYDENGLLVNNSPFVGGMSGGICFDRYGRHTAVIVASDRRDTGISSDGRNLRDMLRLYGWKAERPSKSMLD